MRLRPDNKIGIGGTAKPVSARGGTPARLPVVRALRWGLLTGLLGLLPQAGVTAPAGEYQVKAAFLYNFARFVEWPAQAHRPGELTLCIVGADPFGADINQVMGKVVGNDRWSVRRVTSDMVTGCQLVFIGGAESSTLNKVLAGVRGRPVLTVTDSNGFAERGAVLNFYTEQNKIRFEINIDAARRSGLTISSQLLRLARITHDKSDANG